MLIELIFPPDPEFFLEKSFTWSLSKKLFSISIFQLFTASKIYMFWPGNSTFINLILVILSKNKEYF
jgi:hypothetical protein